MPDGVPTAPREKWFYRPWFVLLMLSPFFLGPFGLPLLWKSPRFSVKAKWLLTIVVAAYTVWLTILVVNMARAVMRHVQELLPAL